MNNILFTAFRRLHDHHIDDPKTRCMNCMHANHKLVKHMSPSSRTTYGDGLRFTPLSTLGLGVGEFVGGHPGALNAESS